MVSERGWRHTGLAFGWIALVVIVLDQWTKGLASTYLELYQPLPLAPMLNLTLSHNTGAAFSFLSDAGGWQRWFFVVLAVGVSGMLLVWLRKLPRSARWEPVALSLVLGGALGNVWDRLVQGYVVDFIDVYYGQWHWPAFNVADSAICVGAAMLVIDALFFKKSGHAEQQSGH
jgi:signal peptidase II